MAWLITCAWSCCRLLDKTKTVRIKALQLLSALVAASITGATAADASKASVISNLQQVLLSSSFPALCATLDAPQTSQLYCAEAAEVRCSIVIMWTIWDVPLSLITSTQTLGESAHQHHIKTIPHEATVVAQMILEHLPGQANHCTDQA
jgi:hypothetical protein